jgi:hypothetical protein
LGGVNRYILEESEFAVKVKKFWIALFATFSICLFSVVWFLWPLFTDCTSMFDCPPERAFEVLGLDIPARFFPHTDRVGGFSIIHDSPQTIEDGIMSAHWDEGNSAAIYIVERFSTEEGAQERFYSTVNSIILPMRGRVNLSFESERAKIIRFSCGDDENFGYRCIFVAQYDEYCVFFNSNIDDEMTFLEYRDIVIYIDRQITQKMAE